MRRVPRLFAFRKNCAPVNPCATRAAGSGVRENGEDLLRQHQRLSRIIYRPRLKPSEKTLPEEQFTGSGNNARLNITDFDVVCR
jgi:hypothetical protein